MLAGSDTGDRILRQAIPSTQKSYQLSSCDSRMHMARIFSCQALSLVTLSRENLMLKGFFWTGFVNNWHQLVSKCFYERWNAKAFCVFVQLTFCIQWTSARDRSNLQDSVQVRITTPQGANAFSIYKPRSWRETDQEKQITFQQCAEASFWLGKLQYVGIVICILCFVSYSDRIQSITKFQINELRELRTGRPYGCYSGSFLEFALA